MQTHADKNKETQSRAVANAVSQKKSDSKSTFHFVDNRSEAIQMRKLQEMANNSPQAKQAAQLQAMADNYTSQQNLPIQKKENNTGLPDNLKSGIENLSGFSMDDVKVHYNSDKPTQLNAHAYAQGADIHLASGQEKHLPHEAWHVVQQKQGRVKPTMQMKGKVNVNDDIGLEKEADVMGGKALQLNRNDSNKKLLSNNSGGEVAQLISGEDRARMVLSAGFMNGKIEQIFIGRITADSTLRNNETSSIVTLNAGTVIAYQGNLRNNFSKGLTSVVKDHVYASVVSNAGATLIANSAHWRQGWVVYENIETDSATSTALHESLAAATLRVQVANYLRTIVNAANVIPQRVVARRDLAPKAIKSYAEKSGINLATPMAIHNNCALGALGDTGLADDDLDNFEGLCYDVLDPNGDLQLNRVNPKSKFFEHMRNFLDLNAAAMPGTMAKDHELRDKSTGGARAELGRAFLTSHDKGLENADIVAITGATLENIFVNSNAPTYAAYEKNIQHHLKDSRFVKEPAKWEPSATIRGQGNDELIDRMTKGRSGEYYLFHGSSKNNIFSIARTGFDPEYVNYTKIKGYGKTGYGTAFTDQFAKALAYSPPEAIQTEGGKVAYKHYILIGRVFAGHTHRVGDNARRTIGNLEMTQYNDNFEESKGNKMRAQGQGMPHLGQSSSTVRDSYQRGTPLHSTVQDRNFILDLKVNGSKATRIGPYRDTSLTISDAIQMFPAYIVEVIIPSRHMHSGTRINF